MDVFLTDRAACLEIATCCRDPRRRFIGQWQGGQNAKWYPQTVRRPGTQAGYFTEAEAWDYIADLIEDHHAVRIKALKIPPGATGYVMIIARADGQPDLYIKLARLRSGTVIGRSFHYSDH